MSEDDETVVAPAAAAGKSKVLPALLVINTLLLTGVLIFVMKRPAVHAAPEGKDEAAAAPAESGHGAAEEKPAEGGHGAGKEASGTGPTVRFDNFTVQLKSMDVERYAHMSIEVEVADEVTKGMVEKRVPQIRDAILSYVSDRTPEELRGSEGLRQIKESLIRRLDDIITGHRIRALYITDFIIQ